MENDVRIVIPSGISTDSIINEALQIAGGSATEIDAVLRDIQGGSNEVAGAPDTATTADDISHGADSILGDSVTTSDGKVNTGREVLNNYGISGNADIRTASGAMVIDDLMQKISTKVQVAAQLLSTANSINKAVANIIRQQ